MVLFSSYRDTAQKLLQENDVIHRQLHQTERDTLDVISFLKRQDQEKDQQVEQLQETILQLKQQHHDEAERLVSRTSSFIVPARSCIRVSESSCTY